MNRRTAGRWGLGEAPNDPPSMTQLAIQPGWHPRQLSRAILWNARWWVVGGSALLIVSNTLMMALPLVLGGITSDVLLPLSSTSHIADLTPLILLWGALLVCVYACMHIGFRFGSRLGWRGMQQAQHALSQHVVSHALQSPANAESSSALARLPAPGALLALSTADVRRACSVLYLVVYPPGELLGIIAAICVLATVHPWLALGTALSLPFALACVHLSSRTLLRRSEHEQDRAAEATAIAVDLFTGLRVLRGVHGQRRALESYDHTHRRTLQAALSARSAEAVLTALGAGSGVLLAAGLTLAAGWLAAVGSIPVSGFVTAAAAAMALIGPVESLTSIVWVFWAQSQASARRILSFLSGQEAAEPRGPGAPSTPRSALGTADFTVQYLTEHETHEVLSQLPSDTAVLPRDPGVFSGSVRQNVAAGRCDEPDTADCTCLTVEAALHAAELSADELAHGYETEVGERGSRLSGGQRQRVALARSLVSAPDFLVLVDPTRAVDAVTEVHIMQSLQTVRAGLGTLVIRRARQVIARDGAAK